jgi:pseudo-rSAM protein
MKQHLNSNLPINLKKDYWLYLEPYVYCKIISTKALLDGNFFKTTNTRIVKMLEDIYNPQNGGVILLKGKDLQNVVIRSFVNHLRNLFMGDIIDISLSLSKPTQVLPLVNLQYDVKKLRTELNRSVGENILSYLFEITIHFDEFTASKFIFNKLDIFLRKVPINVRLTCKFNHFTNDAQYSKIIDFINQLPFIEKSIFINYLQISSLEIYKKWRLHTTLHQTKIYNFFILVLLSGVSISLKTIFPLINLRVFFPLQKSS